MNGLPSGLKYRLTHVSPTTYDEDGYTETFGFYQFASEPAPDGLCYNVIRSRDMFWFGHDGPYVEEERDPQRAVTRVRLWSATMRAWGDNPRPLPPEYYEDGCSCGCGCCS